MNPPTAANALPDVVEKELSHFQNTLDLLHKGAIDGDKVFKPFRLVHGIYGQRQQGESQMVRIKLKYGMVDPKQMRVLADTSEKFTNGISHITTRQAIQFHFVPLNDTPSLMRSLEECGLTTREACGNAVRAVVGSPLAGTRTDEPFAIEPYAEAVFQHFLRGPLSSTLPRKFKIGFGGSDADPLAQVNIQDVGATAVVKDGKQGFRVVAAGGLGATPQAPIKLYDCLDKAELVPVCEAVVRVHHKYGDRQNRAKARLKFVLRQKGDEGFRALFEEQLAAVKAEGIRGTLLPDTLPPANPTAIPLDVGSAEERAWRKWNVRSHREAGLAVVSVCIRRGDIPAKEMRILADLAEKYAGSEVRSTNDQNLIFRRVKIADLSALHTELAKLGYTRKAHSLIDVVSCPGASTCQLGITLSKNLGRELEEALTKIGEDERIMQAHINISGCPNSCGQHHIGTIGLHGAASKIGDKLVPHYVLMIGGGDEGDKVTFGSMIARIPARKVVETITALATWYKAERSATESFVQYLRRINGDGQEKDAAKALKAKLKERLTPIFAYKEGELTEKDLHDLGSDRLFTLDELGAGECMS
ncbi:MAG: nitrite/sulfite reductase [Planctomycetes bacterium]|nr:nitrite/sulfite reductase [Planctomycetota bacterium]